MSDRRLYQRLPIGVYIAAIGISGCASPPHRFAVEDNDAVSATLTLNGGFESKSTQLVRRGGVWRGELNARDANGRIRLVYEDGRTVDCVIGYVTNGQYERHRFEVADGVCEPIAGGPI